MSIIAYYRKSITVKGLSDEESVSYQSYAIEKYAEQNNLKILKEYSDVGYTGSNTNRPELKEMIKFLEENPNTIDEVTLYSIDRLGRDLGGNIETFLAIEKLVGRIFFLSENIDSKHDFFRVYFLLWTAVAEDTKKQLLERTSDAKQSKILNERVFVNGKYALGYTKGAKQRLLAATRQNTSDLQERMGLEIVQFIYYAYLFGMSLRHIAKELNRYFGYTRYYQAAWSHKTVRYVLQNETYIGVLKGSFKNGTKDYFIQDANIEVLVDPLLFELVQEKLKYETVGRRKKRKYPIPQFLVCESCATLLRIEDNTIICPSCNMEVESIFLFKEIQNSLEDYINGEYGFSPSLQDVTERLLYRYQERKSVIEQKIDKMIGVGKEIDGLDQYIPKQRIDEMRNMNQNEISALTKRLFFEENRINYLRKHGSLNQSKLIVLPELKPYLLLLPYIIFVNLETNVYRLFFCQYEAKGGK